MNFLKIRDFMYVYTHVHIYKKDKRLIDIMYAYVHIPHIYHEQDASAVSNIDIDYIVCEELYICIYNIDNRR